MSCFHLSFLDAIDDDFQITFQMYMLTSIFYSQSQSFLDSWTFCNIIYSIWQSFGYKCNYINFMISCHTTTPNTPGLPLVAPSKLIFIHPSSGSIHNSFSLFEIRLTPIHPWTGWYLISGKLDHKWAQCLVKTKCWALCSDNAEDITSTIFLSIFYPNLGHASSFSWKILLFLSSHS